MELLSVKGDAYTVGYQHGSQAGDLVRGNVEYYLYLWKTYFRLERESVLAQAAKFIPAIERYDSDLLKELEGVAQGAGVTLEEIIALNARYELVWSKMLSPQECTAVAASGEATTSGHTLMGENWDYKVKVKDRCLLLEVEQEGKPNIVMHTEAGVIGQKGLNSEGIGLCVNALISDKDSSKPKTPFLLLCRGVLNSGSLGDAIGAVLGTKRAVSGNLLIAHEEGEIIDLEVAPFDVGFLYPTAGTIAHANNFIDPRLTQKAADNFKAVVPDTLIRTARAQRFVERKRGALDIEAIKNLLRDHFNKPNSICRHVDERLPADFQVESLASMIMDLKERTLYLTDGPPCESEYKAFSFESIKRGQPS